MTADRPIFVISDLHMGDGGPRDNFAVRDRETQFGLFLDFVADQQGELIINGDLFEFWQASLSRVLLRRKALLDRLAEMQPVYVVGNHDADLAAFILDTSIDSSFLVHPLLRRLSGPFDRVIHGRRFHFMHGHEADPFNRGDAPSWGRIFAIFAGILEDANGGPILSTGQTVEEEVEKLAADFASTFSGIMEQLWDWRVSRLGRGPGGLPLPHPQGELTPAQNPVRAEEMLEAYQRHKDANGYAVAIVGHTHRPGRRGNWYFNSGSWAGERNNFLQIHASGEVDVCDWVDRHPQPNRTVL
jgi:UDP-2,3-diacylglucosamine pyrophosphatase LpxH